MIQSSKGIIKNLLSISFPRICGGLIAKQRIKDDYTWEIEFDFVGNFIFGFRLPITKFIPGDQIRLWQVM